MKESLFKAVTVHKVILMLGFKGMFGGSLRMGEMGASFFRIESFLWY